MSKFFFIKIVFPKDPKLFANSYIPSEWILSDHEKVMSSQSLSTNLLIQLIRLMIDSTLIYFLIQMS